MIVQTKTPDEIVGQRRFREQSGTGSAGLPRCLRETCGFFFIRAERPQVPAKITRGPALPGTLGT
jgi:hypothetical protein